MNIIVPYLTGDGYFILEGDGWCHYKGNGGRMYRTGEGWNDLFGPILFGRNRGLGTGLFILNRIIIRR